VRTIISEILTDSLEVITTEVVQQAFGLLKLAGEIPASYSLKIFSGSIANSYKPEFVVELFYNENLICQRPLSYFSADSQEGRVTNMERFFSSANHVRGIESNKEETAVKGFLEQVTVDNQNGQSMKEESYNSKNGVEVNMENQKKEETLIQTQKLIQKATDFALRLELENRNMKPLIRLLWEAEEELDKLSESR